MKIFKDSLGLFVDCPNCHSTFDLDTNEYKTLKLTAYRGLLRTGRELLKALKDHQQFIGEEECFEQAIKKAEEE